MGGDPGSILPDPSGGVRPITPPPQGSKKCCGWIKEVIFNHRGCFVGFVVRIEGGGERKFGCTEAGLERLVERLRHSRCKVCITYLQDEIIEIAIREDMGMGLDEERIPREADE